MRNTIHYMYFIKSLSESQILEYAQMSINQQKDWYISYLESRYSIESNSDKSKTDIDESKPLIEQECLVIVKFTDLGGKDRVVVVIHNGDDDCWDGLGNGYNEDFEEDIAFDFNTFGGLSYGDTKDTFHINGYQCVKKDDNGVWSNDDNVEIDCEILKIIPIFKK